MTWRFFVPDGLCVGWEHLCGHLFAVCPGQNGEQTGNEIQKKVETGLESCSFLGQPKGWLCFHTEGVTK